jgi:hypothetical protein
MKTLLKIVVLTLLPAATIFAGTLEAQKDGVEVYTAGDKKSAVITKLKKGDIISSSERKGMFWQVKTKDGKAGFVSVLAVRAKADGNANLNDAIREAVKQGRGAAAADSGRSRSSVMGVRGLDDTSDTGMAGTLKPNMIAVYAMEDLDIPASAVDQQAELVVKEVESRMAKVN